MVRTKKGMINRPVQKLHLLEEYNHKILDRRWAPSQTANVQEMEEPRKNPGNAEEAKRPHNCQRLMTVRGKMKKPKNTEHATGVH